MAIEASTGVPVATAVDTRRASFVGIALARAATRPYGLVMGTYLALLMADRAASAIAITFGLTAHKYVSAIVFPVAGRLSDRTGSPIGRRVPFMAGGLALAAVAVWMVAEVGGYWQLVVAVVVAREAMVVVIVGRIGATPDIFGRSRWILASLSVGVAVMLPALATLALIRATWVQDDPATWATTFRFAAVGLAIAAVAVAVLVRESPASRTAARIAASRSWREELRAFLAQPNAAVVVVGVGLIAAAGAAVGRLLPVWADRVMGVGGEDLVVISLVSAVLSVIVGPLGLLLAARAHPRTLAIVAAGWATAVTAFHIFVASPPVFVVATALLVPLTVAAVTANLPLLLRLVPKAENLGETVGFLAGPFGILMMAAAYLSAVVVDATGTYRSMWLVAAVFLAGATVAFRGIEVAAGEARVDVRRLVRRARRLVGESGGSGRRGTVLTALFGGQVEERDVLEGDLLPDLHGPRQSSDHSLSR